MRSLVRTLSQELSDSRRVHVLRLSVRRGRIAGVDAENAVARSARVDVNVEVRDFLERGWTYRMPQADAFVRERGRDGPRNS